MKDFTESTFLYPNTFYVNDLFAKDPAFANDFAEEGPYEIDLVRAVCVADFLADDNPVAREWFGSVAAVEFFANDSARQEHVEAVLEHVGQLMTQPAICLKLAAGDQEVNDPYAVMDKGESLSDMWKIINNSPLVALQTESASPETVMAARYETMDRHDLGSAILYLDHSRLQSEIGLGSALQPGCRDSVFREAVLRSETLTGVIVFDEIFDSIRDDAVQLLHDTGLAEVRKQWEARHAGEAFLPEEFRVDQRGRAKNYHLRPHEERFVLTWRNFVKSIERWRAVQQSLGGPQSPSSTEPL